MNEEDLRNVAKEKSSEQLATAALVLGIISLFSVFCCCPFVLSALGIILALLSKGASDVLKPRAKTGLALSIIGIFSSLIISVFTIAFPLILTKVNPDAGKEFWGSFEEQFTQNEGMLKEVYGEDVYEQMMDMLDSFQQ